MTILPQPHILTAIEIKQIKSLGFEFKGANENPEQFINTNFPNCGLLSLLSEIDIALNRLSNAVIFKYLYLNAMTPPEIRVLYYTENYEDENTGLALSRIFTWQNKELVVKHDYFRLPLSARGIGIAKKIFQASLQQYVNMGVKKILVHAALQDGGYAWAKNFFTATNQSEMAVILNEAKAKLGVAQFLAVERVYANYYTKFPSGNAFPIVKWAEMPFMKDILRGSSWHGLIDLNNKEQFTNFTSYVFQ